MDWDIIAPMITAIVLFLVIGGVILLRPLTKRLGELLEAMAQEKRTHPNLEGELKRCRRALEAMEDRMAVLEERQDFHEELLRGRSETKRIGARGRGAGEEDEEAGRG